MRFERPEYLYHYTNIESLALILKNRTILFNNLLDLDDLEEGYTVDYQDAGKYYFVSCWTHSDEDNIPMWQMYSDKLRGVRIKMPSNQFGVIPKFRDEYISSFDYKDSQTIECEKFIVALNFLFEDTRLDVQYTDNENDLRRILLPVDNKPRSQTVNALGYKKRSCWGFQKESRYIIQILPKLSTWGDEDNSFSDAWRELYKRDDIIDFKQLFLTIDDFAFENMEIMLGPGVTSGQNVLVEDLVEKYNPKAKITQSILTGKIRV